MRRYLILFPIAAYCLYDMLLVRRNTFSRKREFKIVNRQVEKVIGKVISSNVLERNKNYIYKQDTEEVKLIK
jgi:hypothetical protein